MSIESRRLNGARWPGDHGAGSATRADASSPEGQETLRPSRESDFLSDDLPGDAMIRYLIQFLWLALLLFWLGTGVRIKPPKQMERRGSRLARMALTIFAFVFLLS